MKEGKFVNGLTKPNASSCYREEQSSTSNSRYEAPPPSYFDASHSFNLSNSSTSTLQQQSSMQNFSFNLANPQYINRRNEARFGNPLAHNQTWSPTAEDYSFVRLPKIDFMLRIQSRLSRKAGNVFDSPPVSFSRPVPPSVSSVASRGFHPVILKSENKLGLIGSGFKPYYPGRILAPLDVSAADLNRFLEDIFLAGKVNVGGHIVATAAPISMHMGLAGFLVTKAITSAFLSRNEPQVIETIEIWQENFFSHRGIDMFVIVNGERVTASYVGGIPTPLSPAIATLVGKYKYSNQQDHSEEKKHINVLSEQHKKHRKWNKEERRKIIKRHNEEMNAYVNTVKRSNEVPLLVFMPLFNNN